MIPFMDGLLKRNQILFITFSVFVGTVLAGCGEQKKIPPNQYTGLIDGSKRLSLFDYSGARIGSVALPGGVAEAKIVGRHVVALNHAFQGFAVSTATAEQLKKVAPESESREVWDNSENLEVGKTVLTRNSDRLMAFLNEDHNVFIYDGVSRALIWQSLGRPQWEGRVEDVQVSNTRFAILGGSNEVRVYDAAGHSIWGASPGTSSRKIETVRISDSRIVIVSLLSTQVPTPNPQPDATPQSHRVEFQRILEVRDPLGKELGQSLNWPQVDHVKNDVKVFGDRVAFRDQLRHAYLLNQAGNAIEWDSHRHVAGGKIVGLELSQNLALLVDDDPLCDEEECEEDKDGFVLSLSGQALWDSSLSEFKGEVGGIQLSGNFAVIRTADHNLQVRDLTKGKAPEAVLWDSTEHSKAGAIFQFKVAGQRIAMTSGSDLYLLDLVTGEPIWDSSREGFSKRIDTFDLSPQQLTFTSGASELFVTHLDGTQILNTRGRLREQRVLSFDASGLNLIYVTADHNLSIVSLLSGATVWNSASATHRARGKIIEAKVSGQRVIFRTEEEEEGDPGAIAKQNVFVIDLAGNSIWDSSTADHKAAGKITGAHVLDRTIVLETDSRELFVLDRDGKPLWELTAQSDYPLSVIHSVKSGFEVSLTQSRVGLRTHDGNAFVFDSQGKLNFDTLGHRLQGHVSGLQLTDSRMLLTWDAGDFWVLTSSGSRVWESGRHSATHSQVEKIEQVRVSYHQISYLMDGHMYVMDLGGQEIWNTRSRGLDGEIDQIYISDEWL